MTKEIEKKLDELIKIMSEHTHSVRKIKELVEELNKKDSTIPLSLSNLSIDDAIKIIQNRVQKDMNK